MTYGGGSIVARLISDNVPALPVVIVSVNGVRATGRPRAVTDGIHSLAIGPSYNA